MGKFSDWSATAAASSLSGDYGPLSLRDASIPRTIDVDLQRTLPDHPLFARPGGASTVFRLKTILLSVAAAVPAVGYLQGMNYLCAFVYLLFYEEVHDDDAPPSSLDSDVYAVLTSIVTLALPGYFSQGLTSLLSDTVTLTSLIKHTDPDLSHHLAALGLDLTLLLPQWSLTMLTTSLPWQTVARVWDLLLFAAAGGKSGGGAGVLLFAELGILGHSRTLAMNTGSLCRAVTGIREAATGVTFGDIAAGAGLSVRSFLDAGGLREEVERMGRREVGRGGGKRGGGKRGREEEEEEWTGEGDGRSEERETERKAAERGGPAPPNVATPMTKKRRSALERFAVKNGITKTQPEGRFLFGKKKGGGVVDAAEGFFAYAKERMTPTPAKKTGGAGGGGGGKMEETNGARQVLFAEAAAAGDKEPEKKKGVSFAKIADKENAGDGSHAGGFLSPNSRGFEMTPVKPRGFATTPVNSSSKGGAAATRSGGNGKVRAGTPFRAPHFFTSPEQGGRGVMSPVSKMR